MVPVRASPASRRPADALPLGLLRHASPGGGSSGRISGSYHLGGPAGLPASSSRRPRPSSLRAPSPGDRGRQANGTRAATSAAHGGGSIRAAAAAEVRRRLPHRETLTAPAAERQSRELGGRHHGARRDTSGSCGLRLRSPVHRPSLSPTPKTRGRAPRRPSSTARRRGLARRSPRPASRSGSPRRRSRWLSRTGRDGGSS